MPQSLNLTILHIIFSTKDRRPFLNTEMQAAMHAYLSGTARKLDSECYRVGGTEDHVHLAVRLPRTLEIAKLVSQLKSASSKWAKEQSATLQDFAWQRGYACFSVGPQDLSMLLGYIDDQEKHHEKQNFQDEYRMLLKKCGVNYDEEYVWD